MENLYFYTTIRGEQVICYYRNLHLDIQFKENIEYIKDEPVRENTMYVKGNPIKDTDREITILRQIWKEEPNKDIKEIIKLFMIYDTGWMFAEGKDYRKGRDIHENIKKLINKIIEEQEPEELSALSSVVNYFEVSKYPGEKSLSFNEWKV